MNSGLRVQAKPANNIETKQAATDDLRRQPVGSPAMTSWLLDSRIQGRSKIGSAAWRTVTVLMHRRDPSRIGKWIVNFPTGTIRKTTQLVRARFLELAVDPQLNVAETAMPECPVI